MLLNRPHTESNKLSGGDESGFKIRPRDRFYSWLDSGRPGFREQVPHGRRPSAFEWQELDVLLNYWERLSDEARNGWHSAWATALGFDTALLRARVYWLQATGQMRTREQWAQRVRAFETSTRRLAAIYATAGRAGLTDVMSTCSENKIERKHALLRLALKRRAAGKKWAQIAREIGYSRNYLWRLRTTIGLPLNLR